MLNRLTCITLLFVVLTVVHSNPFRERFSQHFGDLNGAIPEGFTPDHTDPGSAIFSVLETIADHIKDMLLSKICSNQTVAQTFLTEMQQLLENFQSNGSFAQFLADAAQEVAYIQSPSSAALLSSNCTGFFYGLKNAKEADFTALMEKFQYYRIAITTIMKTFRNIIKGSG